MGVYSRGGEGLFNLLSKSRGSIRGRLIEEGGLIKVIQYMMPRARGDEFCAI